MQKISLIAFTIVTAISFSACSKNTAPSTTTSSSTQDTALTVDKKGTTTKTGKILKLSDKTYIQENGKQPAEIDSYSVDLSQYIGKTVTVSGQYSGDTLFVTQVQ